VLNLQGRAAGDAFQSLDTQHVPVDNNAAGLGARRAFGRNVRLGDLQLCSPAAATPDEPRAWLRIL